MKIKWGLKIYNREKAKTFEGIMDIVENEEPIFFGTVKECFEYLGFKIPRVGDGYIGNKYYPCQRCYVEYMLTKYHA